VKPPYRILVIALVAVLASQAGCAGGPAFGELNGEVTLDGVPLQEGVIHFSPLDGSTATASALIVEGRFQLRVPVATHRVKISAPKLPKGFKSSKDLKRGTVDEGEALAELIPPRYNRDSQLTFEVKRGSQSAPFHLSSKPLK
jgi:hypothetical protein